MRKPFSSRMNAMVRDFRTPSLFHSQSTNSHTHGHPQKHARTPIHTHGTRTHTEVQGDESKGDKARLRHLPYLLRPLPCAHTLTQSHIHSPRLTHSFDHSHSRHNFLLLLFHFLVILLQFQIALLEAHRRRAASSSSGVVVLGVQRLQQHGSSSTIITDTDDDHIIAAAVAVTEREREGGYIGTQLGASSIHIYMYMYTRTCTYIQPRKPQMYPRLPTSVLGGRPMRWPA
eukprot:GHVU01220145.1.p1 GENE.GHVU01220145.1~~GHVU01220145.1.p1  ORF type:complete len:238 (+),score=24.68 GHVU01220145.1:26-715(+)